jgi:TPR repeat protein
MLTGHVHGLAEYYLATLYISGNGVTRDTVQAAHWFRKAATHGVAQAELNKLTPH